MKRFTYGISLFFIAAILMFGYYFTYNVNHLQEQSDKEKTIETETTISPEYHIQIHEGKVIVYLKDGSVYETTDITWEDLPQELKIQIENGYILYSAQELYNFLETYSS